MSYISKELNEKTLEYIFGPPQKNQVIRDENLRDLGKMLRAAIEPEGKKWEKVRAESAIKARSHYLN